MLDPPSRDFLPDTVRVFGPAESSSYTELRCRVSPMGAVSGEPGPVPTGHEHRELGFATDPGVSEPDQVIHWIAHGETTFDDPIVLRVTGSDSDPGGGNATVRVFASTAE